MYKKIFLVLILSTLGLHADEIESCLKYPDKETIVKELIESNLCKQNPKICEKNKVDIENILTEEAQTIEQATFLGVDESKLFENPTQAREIVFRNFLAGHPFWKEASQEAFTIIEKSGKTISEEERATIAEKIFWNSFASSDVTKRILVKCTLDKYLEEQTLLGKDEQVTFARYIAEKIMNQEDSEEA